MQQQQQQPCCVWLAKTLKDVIKLNLPGGYWLAGPYRDTTSHCWHYRRQSVQADD